MINSQPGQPEKQRIKKMTTIVILALITLAGQLTGQSQARQINYIPASKIANQIDKLHIIDTRSRLEFNMLHIKGATHIPVGTMMKEDLERVLASDPRAPLVFYCNGYQ